MSPRKVGPVSGDGKACVWMSLGFREPWFRRNPLTSALSSEEGGVEMPH